jgi:hypothetical protein
MGVPPTFLSTAIIFVLNEEDDEYGKNHRY